MSRRRWGAILTAAIVVAGCGTTTPSGSTEPGASTGSATEAPVGSVAPSAAGEVVTIQMESWRVDDAPFWTEQIIPAFEASHPNIKVEYSPTAAGDYDAALNTRLGAGSAGDVMACRAFDGAQALWNSGYLADLSDVAGLANYTDSVLTAWRTDDQKTTFCIPMGGSIHGFIYNADIFTELGLSAPTTQAEFIALLDAIKASGKYTPLAIGTADDWTVGEMGHANIGPNYWKGEEGRLSLVAGTKKFTDPEFVNAWKTLETWIPYLADGYQDVAYTDAQNLFTLGRAAIYPSGSWEIVAFNEQAPFKLGYFAAPIANAGDKCYVNFHTDIGIGINSKADHPAEARQFIEWVTTQEFANSYGNAVVGQVPLTTEAVEIADPLLQAFVQNTRDCETTIRPTYQFLSRGDPNTTTELHRLSAEILRGTMTPEQAGSELQATLDSWYTPAQ